MYKLSEAAASDIEAILTRSVLDWQTASKIDQVSASNFDQSMKPVYGA